MYEKITAPETGSRITFDHGEPVVPDDPIIPFIQGDGTGVDIWPASQLVFDAAVEAAYGGARRINWFKVYAVAGVDGLERRELRRRGCITPGLGSRVRCERDESHQAGGAGASPAHPHRASLARRGSGAPPSGTALACAR